MNEKDLLKQLNKYKDIKPDTVWKSRNREILLKQVFNAGTENEGFAGFDWIKGFASTLRPGFLTHLHYSSIAIALVLFFVMGGGVFSLKAAQNTKPGDSLYLAKIVSEKTQLALAIGEKNKVRLGIAFAGNRAEEINKVMAENELMEDVSVEGKEKVERLVNDFKKEIDSVKNRIAKINLKENKQPQIITKEDEMVEEVVEDVVSVVEIDDSQVFSANLGKDENGIQISDSNSSEVDATPEVEVEDVEKGTTTIGISEEVTSTSSDPLMAEWAVDNDPQSILRQAEEFLNVEDYEATLSKLHEADEIIGQIEIGQVKGVDDQASTSPEIEILNNEAGASSTIE